MYTGRRSDLGMCGTSQRGCFGEETKEETDRKIERGIWKTTRPVLSSFATLLEIPNGDILI